MSMYNLIEYSDNYLKTYGSLCQYCRYQIAVIAAGVIDDVPGNSVLFKFKQKMTSQTCPCITEYVEIMVSFKYLSNFWRTYEMPLTNYKINIIQT